MPGKEGKIFKKMQPDIETSRRKRVDLEKPGRRSEAGRVPEGDLVSGHSFNDHLRLLSGGQSTGRLDILVQQLQQNYGNAYVQRLLKSSSLQARLSVSQPGDRAELEAERVAGEVINKLDSPAREDSNTGSRISRQEDEDEEDVQTARSIATGRVDLAEDDEDEDEDIPIAPLKQSSAMARLDRQEDEDEEDVQTARSSEAEQIDRAEDNEEEMQMARSASTDTLTQATEQVEERINSSRGDGRPLESGVRQSMEQAFGANFNDVKVHTDAGADNLNRALQAQAFTTKKDIFFKEGAYHPESSGGRKLIAHELTHVLQQEGGAAQIETAKDH